MCLHEKRKQADYNQGQYIAMNTSDGKIVNGYDVVKSCMSRPWLVYIQ